jgi:hypothetical protein
MRHAFQVIEGTSTATLPILATASDVREVVQLLKKRPEGITIVEASDAVRKRLFDPRKVAAYELWGIISKTNDRLKLSELGREFASKLEPETQIYRVVLDNTPAYRAVLEWIYQQHLDLVTYADIFEYWEEHFPQEVHQDEKMSEGQVISFLHLCHAGEIGIATVGRKHQPSRLRVDHDELAEYIKGNGNPRPIPERVFSPDARPEVRRPVAVGTTFPKPLMRVLISTGKSSGLAGKIQDLLQIADIECEVVERETDGVRLLSERTIKAMRRCDAGIIAISIDDCRPNASAESVLNQSILVEIGSAFVHFAGQVVLLCDKRVRLPFNTDDFCRFGLEGEELSWETGLQLVRAVKLFSASSQPPGAGVSC